MAAMSSASASAGGDAAAPATGLYTGTGDALFRAIETMHSVYRPPEDQAEPSWGRVLDAGTGAHSLEWLRRLPTESWAAVTADAEMQNTVQKELAKPLQGVDGDAATEQGDIVLGNWDDPQLLSGKQYEVILADYLIGAMDGFSPFKQDLIFERLKQHMAPGGVMYIIGLEPIPYSAGTPAESIMVETTRLRDACILLAGHRCYREYPATWTERMLEANGFKILETQKMPIIYSVASVRRQLNVASRKLQFFKNPAMAAAMREHIADVDRRLVEECAKLPNGRFKFGFDYIIAAELPEGA